MICNAETVPYINAAGEAWYGVRKRGLTSASWTKVDPAAMVNGFTSGQISTRNYDRIHLRRNWLGFVFCIAGHSTGCCPARPGQLASQSKTASLTIHSVWDTILIRRP